MLMSGALSIMQFLSTPSARRATVGDRADRRREFISIHALREEGDTEGGSRPTGYQNFYPRPPRGGRQAEVAAAEASVEFLSTPSARRATRQDCLKCPA